MRPPTHIILLGFALCLTAGLSGLSEGACIRSTKQNSATPKLSTTAGFLGDDQTSQKFSKESFFSHGVKLVPKQAGPHAW